MVKLQINHKDVVLLIMDYLKEQNLLKSMLALEEETNVNLFRYGKEIAFLRQLILEGQWEDVENFLRPAQIRAKIDFNSVLFEIRKQRYLELLETPQLDQHVLVSALKDLEVFCTKEIYNGLCYLLTLERLGDHPEFQNWTIQKGRLQCFESIKQCLSNIYQTQEKRRTPANRLNKLLKDSVIYQYYIAKQTGSMTKFKFDPVTQASEVSLLKDLISGDNQQKFNKQNLNEVKISFYNRNKQGSLINQSQNTMGGKLSTQYQTIDPPIEDDVPEEFDESEQDDEDEDDSQSEYYDHEFAQSMPAHLQSQFQQYSNSQQNKHTGLGFSGIRGQGNQQNRTNNNMMAQSINHNVFQQLNRGQMGVNQQQQQVNNSFTGAFNNSNVPSFNQQQKNVSGQKAYDMSSQQQMITDKGASYKAIQYHNIRQSFDQSQQQQRENESLNSSNLQANRKQQQNIRQLQQQNQQLVNSSQNNFEFQRAQGIYQNNNNSQLQDNQNDLMSQSNINYQQPSQSNLNRSQIQQQFSDSSSKSQQYHNRTGSKAGQNQLQNYSLAEQQPQQQQQQQRKINQPNSKITNYEPVIQQQNNLFSDNSPNEPPNQRKQQQVQNQNFIFQNDSEPEDKFQQPQVDDINKSTKNFQSLNRSNNKLVQSIQQQSLIQNSREQQQQQLIQQQLQQEPEEEEDEYEEDFIDQNEPEEDRNSQQESVRQIQPSTAALIHQQQQSQHHQNYLETDENPQQIISDIDPIMDNNICNLTQRAILIDVQPIRAACFSPRGDHLALGTNSRSLKICVLPNLHDDDEDEEELSPNEQLQRIKNSSNGKRKQNMQNLQVIFEQENHHEGSLYCVDWSRTSRLIASGSNDKKIKLLVCPDFDKNEHSELLEMTLQGHSAIVRTLCFNPTNDLILLSGGLVDRDVKVWDSETGKNISNMKGHLGDVYAIKMSNDGAFAFSVGKDKFIQIWDIRVRQSVHSIDGTSYTDMNDICFSSSPSMDSAINRSTSSNAQQSLNGLACVGHIDGSLTFWDMNMRKCLAQQQAHQQEARGVSFSVDGKYLASAGFDSQIAITDTSDLDNLTPVKTLYHDDKVVSVKWHPFLPLLLSTSADKTARIWYPQTQI